MGESCSETRRKKRKGWWEVFAEKEGIKPRMKEQVGDGIPIRRESMTVGR